MSFAFVSFKKHLFVTDMLEHLVICVHCTHLCTFIDVLGTVVIWFVWLVRIPALWLHVHAKTTIAFCYSEDVHASRGVWRMNRAAASVLHLVKKKGHVPHVDSSVHVNFTDWTELYSNVGAGAITRVQSGLDWCQPLAVLLCRVLYQSDWYQHMLVLHWKVMYQSLTGTGPCWYW